MQSAFALTAATTAPPQRSTSPINTGPFLISSTSPPRYLPVSNAPRFASIRTNALCFNYNSAFSVFPAEACETIGGDACSAEMYAEVKPVQMEAKKPRIGVEAFEREYLDYSDSRTVLLGEACDVLGGEFCEQLYQNGIC